MTSITGTVATQVTLAPPAAPVVRAAAGVRREQLQALTGLRFIAAIYVVIYHATPEKMLAGTVKTVIQSGHIGVGLFFVLSGFILAYNYLGDRGMDRRDFWVARLARVYPVYVLGLLVALPHFMHDMLAGYTIPPSQAAAVIAASTTLVQSWFPYTACHLNCPGWSLSVEALFYLAFPLLAIPMARLSNRQLLGSAALSYVMTLAIIIVFAILGADILNWGQSVGLPAIMKYNPLLRLPEFVMGMALGGLFLRRRRSADALNSAHTSQTTARWLELAAIGGLAAAILFMPDAIRKFFLGGLLAPLFAALVYALAFESGPIARFLRLPLLVLLGEASYALYILHLPLMRYWATFVNVVGMDLHSASSFAAYLVLVIAASILTLRFFEEPARRFVRERLRTRHLQRSVP